MTELRSMHGVDVAVTRNLPSVRGSTVHIAVANRWGRMIRDMGHENVDEDIAHEVRVWLLSVGGLRSSAEA